MENTRLDGLDPADRDLLRGARPDAGRHDLACESPTREAERVGVLRIPTTRGDRLFIWLSRRRHPPALAWFRRRPDPIATLADREGR